jgi:peptide deformylase
LKKRLLKKKLENITKGIADAAYRMRFPKAKRK